MARRCLQRVAREHRSSDQNVCIIESVADTDKISRPVIVDFMFVCNLQSSSTFARSANRKITARDHCACATKVSGVRRSTDQLPD